MFTSRLNLTLVLIFVLLAACAAPTTSVQGITVQNNPANPQVAQQPAAQATAAPSPTASSPISPTTPVSVTSLLATSISVEPLAVVSTSPAKDADGIAVSKDATKIIVQFNHPVVPLVSVSDQAGLPQPLSFTPNLAGSGEWINTSTYSFTPAQSLQVATQYTVNVASLTDELGSKLDSYAWKFTTAAPEVTLSYPDVNSVNSGVSQPISVTFNTEMDRASVESRFSLVGLQSGTAVAGTFQWNGTQMQFAPGKSLVYNTQYRVTLKVGAQDINDKAAMKKDVTWSFRTSRQPGVISTTPRDGDKATTEIRNGLEITYASPMAQDAVTVTIQPTITNEYSYWQDNTKQTITGGWLASQTYTVTISGQSQTVYSETLGSDTVIHFTAAPLDPSVYLNVNGTFGLYDASQPQIIYSTYQNIKSINYALYTIPRADLLRIVGRNSFDYWDKYKPAASNLARQWSQDVSAPLNASALISTTLGGDTPSTYLKPGAYYFQASTPSGVKPASTARHILIVSPYNLALKFNETSALVWATDLATGEPAKLLPITIYDQDGKPLASGTTDNDGVYRATFASQATYNPIFAVSEVNSDLSAAVGSDWSDGIRTFDFNLQTQYGAQQYYGNLYTDRAIYRPGQTVYFRGVLRQDNDARYTLPDTMKTVPIKVQDGNGRTILQQDIPLDAYGTFNGQIPLNADAALGFDNIILEFGPDTQHFYTSVSFQVAEYKTPEYQVNVTTDKDSYVNGDTIKVSVDSEYYFGGPVANAQITWRLLSDDLFFHTDKVQGYYDFTDYDLTNNRQASGGVVSEGKGTTDKQGKFSFTVPADLKDYVLSQNFTIDVEVTDINNAAVSSRAVVPVHKGEYYIGLRPQTYVGNVAEKQGVDVITVMPQGDPSPNQAVTLSVYEHKWYSVRQKDSDGNFYWTSAYTDTLSTTITVTTGVSGTASAYYTPTVGGVFKIVGEGKDKDNNTIHSATYQWIATTNEFVNWRIENNDRIDLVADKKEYRVGDSAKVLIPAPFKGALALMTIERGGILQVKPLGVIGNSDTLEIPITEDFVPTAYVSVMLVKGRTSDSPTPQFKLGYAAFNVNPAEKILNVKVSTGSAATYQPGESVTFNVNATDSSGKPAQAEFSVALVDKAVQALANDTSTPLETTFWGTRGIGIQTASSWVRSIERINQNVQAQAKGGGGGPGNQEASPVRRNFQDTAFWKADVVTDASGKATVNIPLPDNLTTWNFTAKGVTKDTLVGTGTLDIVSTKPVLIRPVMPRFFVPGDSVLLEAVVNNNTAQDVTVDVALQATGLQLSGNATQPLTVKANDKAKVSWQTTVNKDADKVSVQFSAQGNGYNDALATTLPIVRASSPEVVSTSGTVSTTIAEKIQVPANVDTSVGGLDITASPSLAAASLDSLDYLQAYPYDCSEQTASRFFPNVVTYQAMNDFGVANDTLKNELSIKISAQIQRLYALQHGDGGWGLWADDESIPHITAYALLALDAADKAGFTVDANVKLRAQDYLSDYLDKPVDATLPYGYNQRAFVLYAINQVVGEQGSRALNLYERRTQLDNYAKALLMVTLFDTKNNTQAKVLEQDLTASAIPSATGTHWEEAKPDWYMMNTNTRTTAIVMYAIATVDPQNALLKNAVRWLMTMRQAGHWETTQETAWSVLGLAEYMKQSGELNANYTYNVDVNTQRVAQDTVNKDNLTENKQITVEMQDLITSAANDLVLSVTSGTGNLYYSAFLRYYLPIDQLKALNKGIIVARQYYALDQATLKPTGDQITSANIGDYVQVKLTLIAPTDLNYVAVQDPLPSGFEAVDTTLKTTSAGATSPELEKDISDCSACSKFYYPYWYYWANTELHDDRVDLFANYLSRGTYEYTYLMRASVGGKFTVLPTTASQMYEPDVFGRSDGAAFTVIGE